MKNSLKSILMTLFETTVIKSFMTEPLLCRNQPNDLQSRSIDWFLYDRNFRHERVDFLSVLSNRK